MLLLVVAVLLPLGLGAGAALARRPWWWAAAVGVAFATVALVAPQPEAGEPRLAWGDVPFVLVVALFVTGLVWLSHILTRRFWMPRGRGTATH